MLRRRLQVLRRFAGDQRGVAATVILLSFLALVMAGALSIDLGSLFFNARRLQGMADLAAMAAAQGLTTATTDAQNIQNAQAAATDTVALNDWPYDNPATPAGSAVATALTPGVYTPNPDQTVPQRFTPATVSPNAAQVTLTAPVQLPFIGPFLGNPTLHLTRTATAASTQLAAFSIGSGLASLNGGLANTLLSALTGSSVQLSVMNYNALIGANVDLLTYLSALSTRLDLTGGSYNSLLSGTVAMPTALAALGDALGAEGQIQAAAAVNQLVSASVSAPGVQLSALFDLGPYGNQDHGGFSTGGAAVSLNAMSMIGALLTAANGQRQIQLNLSAAAPSLAGLTVYLAVGQHPSNSPWMTITQSQNVIIQTAQARIYLQASVASGATQALQGLLGGALGAVGSLLSGGSSGSSSASGSQGLLNLSAFVQLASAEAKLSSISCSSNPSLQSMSLQVLPSVGTVAVASVNPSTLSDFTTPVQLQPDQLLNLSPLISATLFAQITVGGGPNGWQTVNFDGADIQSGAVKTVSTQNIAQATLASLIGATSIGISVGNGSPLNLSTANLLGPTLSAAITPAGTVLDGVINQLTSLLGVQLGTASVWSDGLRCQGAALVA